MCWLVWQGFWGRYCTELREQSLQLLQSDTDTLANPQTQTPQVFTSIGQLELFYDQAPDVMRSCSMALVLLSVCIGSYLSGEDFLAAACSFLTAFALLLHGPGPLCVCGLVSGSRALHAVALCR